MTKRVTFEEIFLKILVIEGDAMLFYFSLIAVGVVTEAKAGVEAWEGFSELGTHLLKHLETPIEKEEDVRDHNS